MRLLAKNGVKLMSKITITLEGETIEDVRAEMADMLARMGGGVDTQAADPVVLAAVKTETPAETPETTETETVTREADDDADAVATDSDGMPYDPEVHSSSRALNADGTWKAMRGKAAEAKAARAAFKAQGANVTAPAGGLPGAAEKTEAPGLPGAETLPNDEPVTLEKAVEVAEKALADNVTDTQTLLGFYTEATGKSDANEAFAQLQTDETARAKLVDLIEALYED